MIAVVLTDSTVGIALVGLAGTCVTALGAVLAARAMRGRSGGLEDRTVGVIASLAQKVGALAARVTQHDERIERLEEHERIRRRL